MATTNHQDTAAVTMHLTLQCLRHAHATVKDLRPDLVSVEFGTRDQCVSLLDGQAVVRQLLTDALAQLDAIEAGQ